MFAIVKKSRQTQEESDPTFEAAKLALLGRMEVLMERETHRRLRYARIENPFH